VGGFEALFRSRHALPKVIPLKINVGNIDHGMNGEKINIDG